MQTDLSQQFEQICSAVLLELRNRHRALQVRCRFLAANHDEACQQLRDYERKLKDLREYTEQAVNNIANGIKVHEGNIMHRLEQHFVESLKASKEKLKQSFLRNRGASLVNSLLKLGKTDVHDELQQILLQGFPEVRHIIETDMIQYPDVIAILTIFGNEHERLMEDMHIIHEFVSWGEHKQHLQEKWQNAAQEMSLSNFSNDMLTLVEMPLRQILTTFSFSFYIREQVAAECFYQQVMPVLEKACRAALWKAMYAPQAPMGMIWAACDHFADPFKLMWKQAEDIMEQVRQNLSLTSSEERHELFERLKAEAETYNDLLNRSEALKQELSEKL